MPDAVPIVLWSWVPITLILFRLLPPARAAAACLIGGWLLLPTARFADNVSGVEFPYWIMPACLPSNDWTTKARIIGIAALLGVTIFDPVAWRRFRPSAYDLPILGWCLCPIASGLVNGVGVAGSVADSAYVFLSWGMPYLLGRFYFADPAGLNLLARGIVAGGLAYVVPCLVEWVSGPILYKILYGFHPYQFQGASRYLGSRPIVFLEDGNQLGAWMATSALTAAWLWRSGLLPKFLGMPGPIVAGLLVGSSILTQSAGAVALMVAGLVSLELTRKVDRTWPVVLVLTLALAMIGARAANLFDAKALAMRTGFGRWFVDASTKLDRQSFGWRLRVEERGVRVALRKPWLGWSRWDWWRESGRDERPWGLFGLALGMEGLLGWTCLVGALGLPMAAFLGLGPPRFWGTPTRGAASALAGALALNEADSTLNACFVLTVLAAAGGLVGMKRHAEAASAWLRRAQGGSR